MSLEERIDALEKRLNDRLLDIAETNLILARLIVDLKEQMGVEIGTDIKDAITVLTLMVETSRPAPAPPTEAQIKQAWFGYKPPRPSDACGGSV